MSLVIYYLFYMMHNTPPTLTIYFDLLVILKRVLQNFKKIGIGNTKNVHAMYFCNSEAFKNFKNRYIL